METTKLQTIEQNPTLMEKYIIPFLITVSTFFAPTFYWFGAIGFFIAADLVLRLIICKKAGVSIDSNKMWRTVYKFGAGCIFILVAFACEKLFVPDIPVMKIIGGYLILVELKSIDEKAKEMTGFSLFSLVIDKLNPKK
jgi:hypothetical protein